MSLPRKLFGNTSFLSVLLSAALVFAFAPAATSGAALELTVKFGRLSLRADGVPLSDVLEAVAREARVSIVLRGSVDERVNDSFSNLPIDQAIRRLSRGYSTILIYDPLPGMAGDVVLTGVWLTQSGSSPSSELSYPGQHDRPAGPPGFPVLLTSESPTTRQRIIDQLVREQGAAAVAGIMQEATRDTDPTVRRSAIRALAYMNTPAGWEAVRSVIRDPDRNVRLEARRLLFEHRRATEKDDE